MDEQLNLFTLDTSCFDKHFDRYGRKIEVPKWLNYKRCENCERWVCLDPSEQPPVGWGVYGFCLESNQRCGSCSYCQSFKDKRSIEL